MTRLCLVIVAAFVLTVALAAGARRTEANDIALSQTVFNTDTASAGFGGIRGIGTGSITLSGVTGTVNQALLYWAGPTNSDDTAANAAVNFNGTDIVGTNIGLSNDNCWGFANSQAYLADVTALVPGDGVYTLANFIKSGVEINGISLLVFFDDGDNTNNRDVVLFHGNDSNIPNAFDADGWNVSLPGINYTAGSANIELHVSDGQEIGAAGTEDALILNGSVLEPAGHIFSGTTVPNGPSAPATGGGLWDIRDWDVTSFLSPGPNTLTLTTGTASDCVALIVAAIDLPAGAAPRDTETVTVTCDDLNTNALPTVGGANKEFKAEYPKSETDNWALWGPNKWWLFGPTGLFDTKSCGFHPNKRPVVKENRISFVREARLNEFDVLNLGNTPTTISASCDGSDTPTVSEVVAAGATSHIVTNWTSFCWNLTLASSNGKATFDNLVFERPAAPGPLVTFNDKAGSNQKLVGQYPASLIDWGTSATGDWYHSGPYAGFPTKSASLRNGETQGTFSYVGGDRILVSLQLTTGWQASTVTLSCPGNPDVVVSLAPDEYRTVPTGWTVPCSSVTIASTNGWGTNYDNLLLNEEDLD